MVPWIIAGAVVLVVLAAAVVLVFRFLVMVADSEVVEDAEEDDEFGRSLLPSAV